MILSIVLIQTLRCFRQGKVLKYPRQRKNTYKSFVPSAIVVLNGSFKWLDSITMSPIKLYGSLDDLMSPVISGGSLDDFMSPVIWDGSLADLMSPVV